MGDGIVVWGAGAQLPSQHFAGHFAGAPALLVSFVTGLIDGRPVSLDGTLEILPFEADASYARVGIVDTRPGPEADRAFVAAFRARTGPELDLTPSCRDWRDTPTLLQDFRTGPMWEIYNCHLVDFTLWRRDMIYAGELPAP